MRRGFIRRIGKVRQQSEAQMLALIAQPAYFQTGDQFADPVGAGKQAGDHHHGGGISRNTAGIIHTRQRAWGAKTGGRLAEQIAGELTEHNNQRDCEEDQQPAQALLRGVVQDFSGSCGGQQAQATEPGHQRDLVETVPQADEP
ncbi:hypothetical protein D3C86_1650520 [compost metagenome]